MTTIVLIDMAGHAIELQRHNMAADEKAGIYTIALISQAVHACTGGSLYIHSDSVSIPSPVYISMHVEQQHALTCPHESSGLE